MKKLISFALALALVLSVAAVAGISVSAEDEYDYYTVYDAADHETTEEFPSYNNKYKTLTAALEGGFFDSGITRSYNNSFSIEDLNGRRMLKVSRTGTYDAQSVNFFSAKTLASLANKSVGFRFWIQAEKNNEYCVSKAGVLFSRSDDKYVDDTDKYSRLYSTSSTFGSFTTEGAWVTVMWDTDKLGQSKFYHVNNRIIGFSNSKTYSVDNDFLSNLDGICIGISDAYKVGAVYYLDDFQFIYNKGDAPSGGVTEPTITMDAGAAMRIDNTTDGLRFSATVDQEALKKYTANVSKVAEQGMLIAKSGIDDSVMTIDNAKVSTLDNYQTVDTQVVVAKYDTTMETVDDAGVYKLYGSLVKIDLSNANQGYVAKAYIKFENGKVAYSAMSQARTINEVASAVFADKDYFNTLCDNHKEAVTKWL